MAETALERREKIKRELLKQLEEKISEENPNPHNFTISGASAALNNKYSQAEVEEILEELSDENEDNLLDKKTFQTEIYIPRSDKQFAHNFKEYFKSPNINLSGGIILTIILFYLPLDIFNYPENVRTGLLLGLWFALIFGRYLGEKTLKIFDFILQQLSNISSIKKRSIGVVTITAACALLLLFGYSILINGITVDKIPAWELVGVTLGGFTAGTIINKLLF